jgi:citrate lyase beta subunit
MSSIDLFQCIPAYKPAATARMIKSLSEHNCKVLLDIEDSIQDVQTPSLTEVLKRKARSDFEEIVNLCPNERFSFRINSVRNSEFQYDKLLLEKYINKIETVFIPKVESSSDIAAFYTAVPHRYRLNIIIETQNGVDNLNEILCSRFREHIDYVFFGNYDYHLDNDTYPIAEQYSLTYWKIIEPIIAKVESHHLKFGNSPYANIADKATLDFSLIQLTKLCKANFALVSLHKEQTQHLEKLINTGQTSSGRAKEHRENNLTLSGFNTHKQKGRSFSFADNKIITPQEYLLALRKQNG